MEDYKIKLSAGTILKNIFRRIFKLTFIESLLVKKTQGKAFDSFIGKLVPSNYMYSHNSIRLVQREGINYKLDISDLVDHFIYFGFREDAKEKLYSFIKPGMTVLDIGTNMGVTALHFSQRVGTTGKVIGFEPDKINYDKATTNIALNNFKNIVVENIGLGNENTTMKLYLVNDENRGMNRILTSTVPYPFIEIPVRVLDDFIKEHPLKKIDLIKIDVEGFEMNILQGATSIIKQYRPILFIELDDNNLKAHGHSAKDLISFVKAFDYEIIHSETNKAINDTSSFVNCHYDIICTPN
jgi:FkbM family methyltransferase